MRKESMSLLDEESTTLFEETTNDFSSYEMYSLDVGLIPCLDSEKNRVLLLDISTIINRLEKLFLKADCSNFTAGNHKVPWISDMMNYCLDNCKDKELLNEIKDEYSKFLSVSSKIIEGNLRLVIEIAGEYKESSLYSFEDIIQWGNLGLIRAVEKYKLDCNTTFSTYARYWIKHVINRNIGGMKSTYRVPATMIYDGYNLMQKNNELDLMLGRTANIKELSEYTGFSISEIEKLKTTFYEPVSLDDTVDLLYDEFEIPRVDTVGDKMVDVYFDSVRSIELQELREDLMKYLTKKQFDVISMYIGLDGVNYNVEEIAAILNVTPQAASQLKNKAIKKLALIPSFINRMLY